MKKRKSRLLIILTLLLLLGTIVQAEAYEYFPDIPPDYEYADEINSLAKLEIIRGDENGNFNPDKTLTRAEFATLICRIRGEEDEALKIIKSSFSDVPSNHWACGYITKATELGIVNGYGNNKFGPSDDLTYEQAVTVLVRAWGYEDMVTPAGDYPNGYLKIAEKIGIMNGVEIKIGSKIPRKIVAVLIYNTVTNIIPIS